MATASVKPRVENAVEGWKAIADHLTQRTGLDVSPQAARRWSYRDKEPLPVWIWNGRVSANAARLDEWCDRQWAKAGASR